MTEVKYGLRVKKTGKLLNLMEVGTDGKDFCNSTECTLVDMEEYPQYLVTSPMLAEYARRYPAKWYASTFVHPQHNFDPETLEVVKVEITIHVDKEKVELPDPNEYFAFKQKTDKGYFHIQKEWEKGEFKGQPPYDYFQLKEYLRQTQGEKNENP